MNSINSQRFLSREADYSSLTNPPPTGGGQVVPALPLGTEEQERKSTHDACKEFVTPVGGTKATKPSPIGKADVRRAAINLSDRKSSEKALLV